MLNKLIAMFGGEKLAALFTKAQAFLKGKKSYIVGAVPTVQGLAGLISSICGLPDATALIGFVREIGVNPDWKMLLFGLAVMFGRAAISKTGTNGAEPAA